MGTICGTSVSEFYAPQQFTKPHVNRTLVVFPYLKIQLAMSTRKLISSGSSFEAEISYSRAVVQGDWVFVSGTTGFDYSTMTISDDLLQQTEQCLKNISSALEQAEATLEDVVRVTYVLPNGSEFSKCWPVLRKYFGEVRPAATMIAAGLSDPRMQIEIEVTALKQARCEGSNADTQQEGQRALNKIWH